MKTKSPLVKKATNILILGMHRSGTSTMAKLIVDSGYYAGPEEDLEPGNVWNEDGYYELKALMQINNMILWSQGATWDQPLGFDAQQVDGSVRQRANGRIEQELPWLRNWDKPWVIKDPRLCLTLPILRRVFPDAYVIVMARHPLEVARSLFERDGIPFIVGVALWEAYMDSCRESVRDIPHSVVNFDELRLAPANTLKSINISSESDVSWIRPPTREDPISSETNEDSVVSHITEEAWTTHLTDWCSGPMRRISSHGLEALRLHARTRSLGREVRELSEEVTRLRNLAADTRGSFGEIKELLQALNHRHG